MTLGEIILRLRKQRGMPQQTLADAARISASHLSLIERDKREPSLRVLARLATALGRRVRIRWVEA